MPMGNACATGLCTDICKDDRRWVITPTLQCVQAWQRCGFHPSLHQGSPMPDYDLQIDTDRLALRPHTRDDFADSLAMWSDTTVTRHIGGRPFTREEIWARLLRYVGHWALLGFGFWVIRERATGCFLGEVGFADYQRDIDPPLNSVPEAGWALSPHAQGKGYATEALRAITSWADRRWQD